MGFYNPPCFHGIHCPAYNTVLLLCCDASAHAHGLHISGGSQSHKEHECQHQPKVSGRLESSLKFRGWEVGGGREEFRGGPLKFRGVFS